MCLIEYYCHPYFGIVYGFLFFSGELSLQKKDKTFDVLPYTIGIQHSILYTQCAKDSTYAVLPHVHLNEDSVWINIHLRFQQNEYPPVAR